MEAREECYSLYLKEVWKGRRQLPSYRLTGSFLPQVAMQKPKEAVVLGPQSFPAQPSPGSEAQTPPGSEDNPSCGVFSALPTPSCVCSEAGCRNLWKLPGQEREGNVT